MNPPSVVPDRWVLASLVGVGASAVMTQLALMRELLCAFCGNELVLGVILGNWLLLSGLGAWLGRHAERWQRPGMVWVWLQLLVAVLPLAQVSAIRLLRNTLFLPGRAAGVAETLLSTGAVLLPYCLASGGLLALACALLVARSEGAAAGRVYVADSLGSLGGGVLFSFVLVRWYDHLHLLAFPAVVNLVLAAGMAAHLGRKFLLALAGSTAAAVAALVWLADLDALSTARQYPGQEVVFRGVSPYGKLLVTRAAGQLTFIENGLPTHTTHEVERAEEVVHYAMAQRPEAGRVLLVSGGIAGTLAEILKYGVKEVTYVELDPLVFEAGRCFRPDALADARIRIVPTDGRLFVRQARGEYDVVILDLPDPSTSQINRFYTAEFFAEVHRALSPQGVVAFSLGGYENYVSPELATLLASAFRTVHQSFKTVLALPGGRVSFVASDGALDVDIASRLEQARIGTQFVSRHYLEAMFTPDRLADMRRATMQPAALNQDFNPVLYYYHLRHWMRQFRLRFGVLAAALSALLVLGLLQLRGAAFALFVSGFAGSSLEVVLLLGFQVLCGSLYQQVGVLVTTFMAGLAAGAFAGNRLLRGPARSLLSRVALAVAAWSALVPLALQGLSWMGDATMSVLAARILVPALTLGLALLVGAQFPLANRVLSAGGAATAARLYAADFFGAAAGALLAGTWFIPVLGMTTTCLLAGALNVAGAVVVRLGKAGT